VDEFVRTHDQVYVVDMNRDGQMYTVLVLAYPQFATRLFSVACNDGLPASAKWIREGILKYRETFKPVRKLPAKRVIVSASSNGKKTAKKVSPVKAVAKAVKKVVLKKGAK
jgi:hypothetical protein